jgi:hypothetical protein
MTKCQTAMVTAMDVISGVKQKTRGRPNEGKEKAAKAAGISLPLLSQAMAVKIYASELAPQVRDGSLSLRVAYERARTRKKKKLGHPQVRGKAAAAPTLH